MLFIKQFNHIYYILCRCDRNKTLYSGLIGPENQSWKVVYVPTRRHLLIDEKIKSLMNYYYCMCLSTYVLVFCALRNPTKLYDNIRVPLRGPCFDFRIGKFNALKFFCILNDKRKRKCEI